MTDRPPRHHRRDEPPTDADEVEDDHLVADDDGYDDGYDGYDVDDEDGYVEVRPPRSGRRRWPIVLLVLFLVFVILVGAAAVVVQRQIDPPGEPGEPEALVVPAGSTADDIGRLLAAEGIISSELAWEWYLRIKGGGPFEAGTYQLAMNSSIPD